MFELNALLLRLDPQAELVQRHLWLIELLQWIRGDARSAAASTQRVQQFLDGVEQTPDGPEKLRAWWQALLEHCDATALLADNGFASRSAFVSEFFERLRLKVLPSTPETTDASTLFAMAFCDAFDAQWVAALDEPVLLRLGQALAPGPTSSHVPGDGPSAWSLTVLEAITFCTSQVRAAGFSPELRQRMSVSAREQGPFHALAQHVDAVRDAYLADPRGESAQLALALQTFREQLEACRRAAASVYSHLDVHGISVNLVFQLRQLRQRVLRIRALLDCLLPPHPAQSTARLLSHLVIVGQERLSLRALLASNTSLLATKVAERSSETGEHYITRNMSEYRAMLRQAAGGGAVMAVTTLLKFAVLALGLSAFWGGLLAGVNYAASFVLIQLLHWTVATKQPAMTAPAMAAKLKELGSDTAVDQFVDEVTHLVRSQVAAIVGNLALVVPCVWLLCAAVGVLTGSPVLNHQQAEHVLHSLSLWSATPLFAAFTGVLLFASSIMAGWAENWFVLHRLDSALRYHPRITAALGVERAARWAVFGRTHISGFTANISLGLMLGLLPAFLGFFGLALEVRHVTLSTGQLAAAVVALGLPIFSLATFWWCVAGLLITGLLNVGVSFYLAFRLALRAHNVSGLDRSRIRRAIGQRARTEALSFLWPRHAGGSP